MLETEEYIDFDEVEAECFTSIETQVLEYTEYLMNMLDQHSIYKKTQTYSEDPEKELLKLLVLNKDLRKVIDSKLEILAQFQTECENNKQDRKLLTNSIKETHESFLMARKTYKKFFNFYYTIETRDIDQVIFVQFFTESRKDSEKYSVRLSKNTSTGKYSLKEINSTHKNYKDIENILECSNNVPGVLAYIRQGFASIIKGQK